MDLDQLRQILDLVREHALSEFEIETEGLRLKIRKDAVNGTLVTVPAALTGSPAAAVLPVQAGVPVNTTSPAAESPGDASPADAEIELAVVKSPIVGTFYLAPEPGAANFVEIGSAVKKGDVLCIIEAMKLMNEIDSEYDGEIVSVYVENGQPVQYGERLFAIRTR
jgi:acetyl-CoA carboxylase biotin carboxyl carrier protein